MCRAFLYGAAILALFCFVPNGHASGHFLESRPFTVRDDLVLEKSKKISVVTVSQEVLERYLAGMRDYGSIVRAEGDKKEKKWDEFQYGSFRLRLSRYKDLKPALDAVRPGSGSGLWETIKSFSSQSGGAPDHDTLEAMGRIFTPEFDLGIEF